MAYAAAGAPPPERLNRLDRVLADLDKSLTEAKSSLAAVAPPPVDRHDDAWVQILAAGPEQDPSEAFKLATQTEDVKELTALRERNAVLEEENLTLTWSDTWKKWLTGAAIAGVFLLVGGIWPSSAQRARKIKL